MLRNSLKWEELFWASQPAEVKVHSLSGQLDMKYTHSSNYITKYNFTEQNAAFGLQASFGEALGLIIAGGCVLCEA